MSAYGGAVRYIRIPNGGVARARNIGTRYARGKYLTFLDSDDLLYPYAVELEARLLERFPAAAFVCAEMSGFDDQGYSERYHLKAYHSSAFRDPSLTYERLYGTSLSLEDAGVLPDGLVRDDPGVRRRRVYSGNIFDSYLVNFILCQNTTMLRRDVAQAVGERNERVRYYEELDYLLEIARHHDVCFVDVPTYRLRYHDGQISTTARADGRYIWMRKQQELLRVIRRHAVSDRCYYARRRRELNRHLAHLHRAVAVPMMLTDASPATRRRYVRGARLHLVRGWRYGHPAPALSLVSLMPGPTRRAGVRFVEGLRRLRWTLAGRLARGR